MSEIEERMTHEIVYGDDTESSVKALGRLATRTELEYRNHSRRLLLLANLMRNRKVPYELINLVGQSALYLAEMSVARR